MTDVSTSELTGRVSAIFRAIGSPAAEAEVIAHELVLADRMGVGSHGVIRVAEYVAGADAGRVVPGGEISVSASTPGALLVDGGRNFGQIVGRVALEAGTVAAREQGVSCVVTRNSYHIGRVGSLAERAAGEGLICIASVAVGLPGVVAPWGSSEGVLGTNPFVYGVPLVDGAVVADFATSTMAEGAVRLAHGEGRKLPDGVLVDADGFETNDPGTLFADPPGAILPFGGAHGYKGSALNMLPELVAATLAGYGPDAATRPSNCLFMVVVDPDAFLPAGRFEQLSTQAAEMISHARPRRGGRVMLPGQLEAERLRASPDSVSIADHVADELDELERRFALRP
jgi:hydroxycarboxylate dehydrogenase B